MTAMTLRPALMGGAVTGGIGAVVGLVIGLNVYAPTAWAAAAEVGLPAMLLGFLLGLLAEGLLRLRR